MAWKCKKCGSKNVIPLEMEEHSKSIGISEEGIGMREDREEPTGKIVLICSDCDNCGSAIDNSRFEIIQPD
jgi:hypothetical protein